MKQWTIHTFCRCCSALALAICTGFGFPPQVAAKDSATPAERIYWRQNLLTIPYKLNAAASGAAPHSVELFASKDLGRTWQCVSTGQPQVLAFNYRAEADGEYWFAIRTVDVSQRGGQPTLPVLQGAMAQPEWRVVVDTTMPKIESVSAQLQGLTSVEVRWRASDANLSAHSCHIEVQLDGSSNWRPVALTNASEVSPGIWEGTARYAVEVGPQPVAVRVTAIDLAGNHGVYQTAVAGATATHAIAASATTQNPFDFHDFPAAPAPLTAPVAPSVKGWVSSSVPSVQNDATQPAAEPQLWPANRSSRHPNDESGGIGRSIVYGTPAVNTGEPNTSTAPAAEKLKIPQPTTESRPLGFVPPPRVTAPPQTHPFQQVSLATGRTMLPPREHNQLPNVAPPPTNPLAKQVKSRTFLLEYELPPETEQGIASVELWGTRDNGASWQCFAVDDDNRSPLRVSVDSEGEYGFSILVISGGMQGGVGPHSGDTPELWVNVDLAPPQIQILAIDAIRGGDQGEVSIRWDADDDNLESRPISLYYSSRPAGPWSTIATSVENRGEYRWPVQRHIPRKVYLKVEARDTAGNIAEFRTSEPILVERATAAVNWQRLPPVN